jgi:hypothetical protein
LSTEISGDIARNNITIPFEKKKNNKTKAKKKQEEVFDLAEEEGNDEMFCFREGEYVPGEGEKVIAS